ncbi:MAG: hypothetical protein U9N56_02245 [Actinomycetota bacterium]|nr:hypothetical protein [Actinomycetota bacterium]
MRRLLVLVTALTVLPASSALAAELDDLLEQSRDASYSAEQIISCSTPDGVRDAVVWIAQSAGEIHIGAKASQDMEIAAGYGGWTLSDGGGVVSSASVNATDERATPVYAVEEVETVRFLGRPATTHHLIRDGVLRAELVFDDETSAMVGVTTFSADGATYCERRFVSFDPTDPRFDGATTSDADQLAAGAISTSLPESVVGFDRLDFYEDEDGFRFGYYSDGFFSFAVFETPTTVALPGARPVEILGASYRRSFTAGQVTYVWETVDGGMALVGDLPPDLHEPVITALPDSARPGLLRRLWRSLFG